MKNTAARRKGQTEATVYRRFFVSGGKNDIQKGKGARRTHRGGDPGHGPGHCGKRYKNTEIDTI